MQFNLQKKLMLLLLAVIFIALSSAVLVRSLVIRDFRAFGEGRMLDQLYRIQAVLEGRYQQHKGWQAQQVADDLVWARLSGFDLRLYDSEEKLVLDTGQALVMLPEPMKERVAASLAQHDPTDKPGDYHTYPLFMAGEEIGHLEVRLPSPPREQIFISASNKFLTYSVAGLGIVALTLSIFTARRLARPLRELTLASEALATGDAAPRVQVGGKDEIGRLAAAFNRMADSLEQQERLRRKMLSNAAHELRTPLMVIRGELEGMMDGILPTTGEALQSLHDETTRLTGIMDGMDDLTKAQAASLTLQRREIILVPFLKELLSRFARQAEASGIKLDVAGDERLTAWIDPDLFTRIIVNLFSNATRAMPSGGQFDLLVTRQDDSTTLVEIMDTGCGIAPEQLPHIFERFYKGENGGLGLGLAIVKELVEAQNGTINVNSEPGKGTCFLITLPCYQTDRP